MKNHYWKSSEKPLYVRLIWKKSGIRHAILYREETKVRKVHIANGDVVGGGGGGGSCFPEPTATKTSTHDNNLENCLTKLKLDGGGGGTREEKPTVPIRAASCEPTLLCNSSSLVRKVPSGRTSQPPILYKTTSKLRKSSPVAYYYVNNLRIEVPSSSENGGGSENGGVDYDCAADDTFTERILQWLSCSNGSSSTAAATVTEEGEESAAEEKMVLAKEERPKTCPDRSRRGMMQKERVSGAEYDEGVDQMLREVDTSPRLHEGCRPQLHIFVPVFRSDQYADGIRKCKSVEENV